MAEKKLHFETLQLHVGQEQPDPALLLLLHSGARADPAGRAIDIAAAQQRNRPGGHRFAICRHRKNASLRFIV